MSQNTESVVTTEDLTWCTAHKMWDAGSYYHVRDGKRGATIYSGMWGDRAECNVAGLQVVRQNEQSKSKFDVPKALVFPTVQAALDWLVSTHKIRA